jgi:YD repeat-containing protein
LNTSNIFIPTGIVRYDQYGNPTNTISAAGISTTTYFDTTYRQYPIQSVTATFTNLASFDIRSGQAITATDVNGLVASNYVDVFYRTKETYISTNAYGAPTLWRTRMDYNLGGLSGGISYNYIRKRVFDGVDTTNGYEAYVYSDGLGRAIQTRAEAETGQYRVSDVLYDERGNANYQTLPRFGSGTGFTILTGTQLGTLTEFDSIGRAFRVTPAYQVIYDGSGNLVSQGATGGDSGSPVAPVTTAFKDGSDPWATVVTDSENKAKKSYVDGFGRVTDIFEVCSGTNIITHYTYDLLGNLTYVTDAATNYTMMVYDSLGRKTSMTDPDMGTWSYLYDNAGRMTQQHRRPKQQTQILFQRFPWTPDCKGDLQFR